MSEEQKGIPQDFVFCGRLMLQGDKPGISIRPINEDGTLGRERVFNLVKQHKNIRLVGGVYTGARFDAGHSYGLNLAKYERYWPEQADRIEWEAADAKFERERSYKRLEADAAKRSEIDTILLPVRQMIERAYARGDWSTATAIRDHVQQALMRPVLKREVKE